MSGRRTPQRVLRASQRGSGSETRAVARAVPGALAGNVAVNPHG